MATQTSLAEFEPFFGGDKKGSYLVQAMFTGTNYSDTKLTPPSGALIELMRAENYKNYKNVRSLVNGQGQNPDDVPQDFTDLIITTALFHRSIDKPTLNGATITKINSDLKQYFDQIADGNTQTNLDVWLTKALTAAAQDLIEANTLATAVQAFWGKLPSIRIEGGDPTDVYQLLKDIFNYIMLAMQTDMRNDPRIIEERSTYNQTKAKTKNAQRTARAERDQSLRNAVENSITQTQNTQNAVNEQLQQAQRHRFAKAKLSTAKADLAQATTDHDATKATLEQARTALIQAQDASNLAKTDAQSAQATLNTAAEYIITLTDQAAAMHTNNHKARLTRLVAPSGDATALAANTTAERNALDAEDKSAKAIAVAKVQFETERAKSETERAKYEQAQSNYEQTQAKYDQAQSKYDATKDALARKTKAEAAAAAAAAEAAAAQFSGGNRLEAFKAAGIDAIKAAGNAGLHSVLDQAQAATAKKAQVQDQAQAQVRDQVQAQARTQAPAKGGAKWHQRGGTVEDTVEEIGRTFFEDPERKTKYKNMFFELIATKLPATIRLIQNANDDPSHTTLEDTAAKTFFETVYHKWPTMQSDIRKFYTQNVTIFAKYGSPYYNKGIGPRTNQPNIVNWVRLTEDEINDLFTGENFSISNPKHRALLRVNLMKNLAGGSQDVLFSSNLPEVPSGSNVWFSTKCGGVAHVQTPDKSFIKDLYNAVYMNTGDEVDAYNKALYSTATTLLNCENSAQSIVIEYNLDKRPKEDYNLDLGKFTSAAFKRDDDMMATQSQTMSNPDVSDELDYPFLSAYDTVYGKLWTFDMQKKQYYRIDGSNRKVYYDDASQHDAKTCYATYLSKGNDAGCQRILKCILNGDSKSLNRCLDVIGDMSLWDIAADDAQKVGPDKVKAVLRKFGVMGYIVPDANGVNCIVPMSYERWVKEIVDEFEPTVRDTIKKNRKLLNYIKGLIGVCISNPNIINVNVASVIKADMPMPKYAADLHMPKYRIPVTNNQSQYQYFAQSLRNATQPQNISSQLYASIINGYGANMSPFNPWTSMNHNMLGGGHSYVATHPSFSTRGTDPDAMDKQSNILKNGSASMYSSLLQTISSAFADTGLKLHHDDQNKLTSVLGKLEKYENQLARMCSVLIMIVKIARFYGISLENIDKDRPRIMNFSTLNTINDIRDFVRGYARDLTKNMVNNMTIQQAASHELMSGVGPRLMDECFGTTKTPSPYSSAYNNKQELVTF